MTDVRDDSSAKVEGWLTKVEVMSEGQAIKVEIREMAEGVKKTRDFLRTVSDEQL